MTNKIRLLSRSMLLHTLSLIGALAAAQAYAAPRAVQSLQGQVVFVDDGDTVVLLTESHQQVKIRLASIDAPESSHTNKEKGRIGQPYSSNSKQFLESLVKGKRVDAQCPDTDRYGRMVCFLTADGRAVNAEMVRSGWAWANTASNGRYLRDKGMLQMQEAARQAKIGLWAGSAPVAPWEWRKQCWEQGVCTGNQTTGAGR